MKTNLMIALTLALAIVGCSTNSRMLAPDPDPAGRVSPELSSVSRGHHHDPVCGGLISSPEGPWYSCHRGVAYSFDCTECKTVFDESPELYVSP